MNSVDSMVLSWLEGINKNILVNGTSVALLKNIGIKILRNEYVSISGLHGQAKAAFIKIIGCLENPGQGKYIFDYEDTAQADDKTLATIRKNKIGFVFSQNYLNEEASILENVTLPLKYDGLSESTLASKTINLLDQVGITADVHMTVKCLNALEKRKVTFARALLNNPLLILIDEPTYGLQNSDAAIIKRLLEKINKTDICILIFTEKKAIADSTDRHIVFDKDSMILDQRKIDKIQVEEVESHCTS